MMAGDPQMLSVVVTIVDGGAALERCLQALADQVDAPDMEILVPFDQASGDVTTHMARFPQATFLDISGVFAGEMPGSPLEMHKFFDKRRSEALLQAKGDLIAIIEDRGVPKPDWAREMVRLHDEHPRGVIGGGVDNGVDRLVNWAIFFCDFGRYQPPLNQDDPEYVTDTNIVYKRQSLMAVRELWRDRYHEPIVNWELRKGGHGLLLSDRAVTVQRRDAVRWGDLIAERFHWARLFGRLRGREVSSAERTKLLFMMPLLPFVLLIRHFRRQLGKQRDVGRFVLAAPITLLLLVFWAAGEFVGYLESGREG